MKDHPSMSTPCPPSNGDHASDCNAAATASTTTGSGGLSGTLSKPCSRPGSPWRLRCWRGDCDGASWGACPVSFLYRDLPNSLNRKVHLGQPFAFLGDQSRSSPSRRTKGFPGRGATGASCKNRVSVRAVLPEVLPVWRCWPVRLVQ